MILLPYIDKNILDNTQTYNHEKEQSLGCKDVNEHNNKIYIKKKKRKATLVVCNDGNEHELKGKCW